MTRKTVVKVAVAGVGLVVAATALWTLFDSARERVCMSACQSDLRLLASSMAMYAIDWDGHMPRRPKEGDFMGTWKPLHGEGLGRHFVKAVVDVPGPVEPYCKNSDVGRCPSDPDNSKDTYEAQARSSYEWNLELCGKRYDDVIGKPLVWDKGPWHRLKRAGPAGRNVAFVTRFDRGGAAEWAVRWMSEAEFEAMRR